MNITFIYFEIYWVVVTILILLYDVSFLNGGRIKVENCSSKYAAASDSVPLRLNILVTWRKINHVECSKIRDCNSATLFSKRIGLLCSFYLHTDSH